MKMNHIKNIRLPTALGSLLFLPLMVASCDNEWPDDYCPCHQGGIIGGWEESDTTEIIHKDSTSGFSITLENWGNRENKDITL